MTVSVPDKNNVDSGTFTLSVVIGNKAPVIEPLDDIFVDEGDTVTLSPSVVDPDGDAVEVTYSGFMTSDTKTIDYDSVSREEGSAVFEVVVTASDGKKESDSTVKVIVNDVNRPPVFTIEQG